MSRNLWMAAAVFSCCLNGLSLRAEEVDPSTLTAIGGHWYLKPGDEPTYYFNDAGRYVDLFSYHTQDSNKDGIDNLQLSHDSDFLIMESQGYPNHPTAIFPNSGNPNSIRIQKFTFRLPYNPSWRVPLHACPWGR